MEPSWRQLGLQDRRLERKMSLLDPSWRQLPRTLKNKAAQSTPHSKNLTQNAVLLFDFTLSPISQKTSKMLPKSSQDVKSWARDAHLGCNFLHLGTNFAQTPQKDARTSLDRPKKKSHDPLQTQIFFHFRPLQVLLLLIFQWR